MKILLLQNFRFAQSEEKFLHNNSLPVLTYTVNIWCALKVDKNIVNFANEINVNYGIRAGVPPEHSPVLSPLMHQSQLHERMKNHHANCTLQQSVKQQATIKLYWPSHV